MRLRMPMVILACVATVIASQAVISGAFSVTRQAVQLGYLPRLRILQTSNVHGQIYIPFVNWTLFVAVLILVFAFQRSEKLASAYGDRGDRHDHHHAGSVPRAGASVRTVAALAGRSGRRAARGRSTSRSSLRTW